MKTKSLLFLIPVSGLFFLGCAKSNPEPSLPDPTPQLSAPEPLQPFVATLVEGKLLNTYQVHLRWPKEFHSASYYIERVGGHSPKHFEVSTNPVPATVDEHTTTLQKYEYQLFERRGNDVVKVGSQTVQIPVDIWADDVSSLQNLSGMKHIGLLILAKDKYLVNGQAITIDALHLRSSYKGQTVIESFDEGQKAIDGKEGRPAGQIILRTRKAHGKLSIRAIGEASGHTYTGRGGASPRVYVQIEEESDFKVDVFSQPGRGGENGKDGELSPYCVRNGASEQGDCTTF